jgi:hypothetical protein
LTRTESTGTVEVDAEPGNLCLYIQYPEAFEEEVPAQGSDPAHIAFRLPLLTDLEAGGGLGAGKSGALLINTFGSKVAEGSYAQGYWVVRAP